MQVLVTGANGFVGKALCRQLIQQNYSVRAVVRSEEAKADLKNIFKASTSNLDIIVVQDIVATNWSSLFEGVEIVVHLVARVHVLAEKTKNKQQAAEEYYRVNVKGTKQLAEAAAKAGVKRLIYLSSIKVNGEKTDFDDCSGFNEQSKPDPADIYGQTKWQAEQELVSIANKTTLEYVILRPPLIYGPGVKANFLNLIHLVKKGLPLPLASVNNRRSLIYVGNLVDTIILCMGHPNAKNQLFMVSDGNDVSIAQLIQAIAKAHSSSARLLSFPIPVLRLLGKLTGKSSAVEKLVGSLVVDSTKIRNQLDWHPPFSLEQALEQEVIK